MRAARRRAGAAEPGGEAAAAAPPARTARRSATSVTWTRCSRTPSEWSHDPWSGDIADGFLWGRGALDMKSQVAAEIAAAADAGALGLAPGARRTADRGGRGRGDRRLARGQWLTENHPEKVRCDLLINEGGGRGVRIWRPPPALLRRLLRGEGRVPLHDLDLGGRRPRLDAGHGRQRAAEDGPLLERFAAASPSLPPKEEPLAFLAGSARTPMTCRDRLSACAPTTPAWRSSSSR